MSSIRSRLHHRAGVGMQGPTGSMARRRFTRFLRMSAAHHESARWSRRRLPRIEDQRRLCRNRKNK